MSKQEAMEWIFNYLTSHEHKSLPATREIRVSGDSEGSWFVEIAFANNESQWGKGADFAEAFANATNSRIC